MKVYQAKEKKKKRTEQKQNKKRENRKPSQGGRDAVQLFAETSVHGTLYSQTMKPKSAHSRGTRLMGLLIPVFCCEENSINMYLNNETFPGKLPIPPRDKELTVGALVVTF